MRIEERKAAAGKDVRKNEIEKHGRFARSGFADDVDVMAAVFRPNTKGLTLFAEGRLTETFYFL